MLTFEKLLEIDQKLLSKLLLNFVHKGRPRVVFYYSKAVTKDTKNTVKGLKMTNQLLKPISIFGKTKVDFIWN